MRRLVREWVKGGELDLGAFTRRQLEALLVEVRRLERRAYRRGEELPVRRFLEVLDRLQFPETPPAPAPAFEDLPW